MSGQASEEQASASDASIGFDVYTSPYRQIGGSEEQTFSPVTSTLIYGRNDAVLVDAQFIREDIDALCEMIERRGRRLTTIYITHAHADHYFGIDRIMDRFPGARAVATEAVVKHLIKHSPAEFKQFSSMFGDDLVIPTSLPTALDDDFIELESEQLRIIEVGQGDIPHSTVLYVPSIGAVIAGDVAYNGIHQMLGLSGPAEWSKWIESVDKIESLHPKTVIAGHKQPGASDDATAVLESTRSYIRDFAEEAATSSTARELVSAMMRRYPGHGNLATLFYSASAAIKAKAS